jgi:hypothetical protein
MSLLRIPVLKRIMSLTCSFYLAFLLQSYLHLSKPYFLIAGLLLFIIGSYIINGVLNKLNNSLFNKNVALISAAVAIFVTIALGKNINPVIGSGNYTVIKVTALGEKSDSAQASEVWIEHIFNGDESVNKVWTSRGWNKENGALVSYKHQPASIKIQIDDPVSPSIQLLKHPWSGKVKIEEGGKSVILDLYDNTTEPYETFEYISNGTVFNSHKDYTGIERALLSGICFLALFVISYLFLITAKVKNDFFLMLFFTSLIIFLIPSHLRLDVSFSMLMVAVSLAIYFIMTKSNYRAFLTITTKSDHICFYLIVLYGGFAFIGHHLFFSHSTENTVVATSVYSKVSKFVFLILFSSWLLFLAFTFLYFTNWAGIKLLNITRQNKLISNKPHSRLKLYSLFLGILLASWSIYLIAFFPGILTTDSLAQWGQLVEQYPYNDWLPIAHTLVYKALLSICFNPAIISIAQMLFLGSICASFLVFLYKTGIPFKWLVVFAVTIGLIPVNGMYTVTLWKDLAYCCSLLWLTLVLAEIITKTYIFNCRTTLICLVVSLFCVATFRHNGLLATIIIAGTLIIGAFRVKRRAIALSAVISVIVIFSFNFTVRKVLPIIPVPRAVRLTTPVHGIAAVIFYGGKLSDHTRQEMLKILPDSSWKSLYYPYSADNYLFWSKTPFIDNLSQWSTSKGIGLYLDALKTSPSIVLKDRLYGTELLWNVSQGEGSFNFVYDTEIYENPYGLKQRKNPLKKYVAHFLEFAAKNGNSLFFRAGIYNLMFLLLCLLLIKRHKKMLLIFLPLTGANLSLALAMAHQDFRYVYYVPLTFGFVWLFAISNPAVIYVNSKLYPTTNNENRCINS